MAVEVHMVYHISLKSGIEVLLSMKKMKVFETGEREEPDSRPCNELWLSYSICSLFPGLNVSKRGPPALKSHCVLQF
jgi:hypothetical protein